MNWLKGKRVVSIAANVPGPTACHRLAMWGASITKIEPISGS